MLTFINLFFNNISYGSYWNMGNPKRVASKLPNTSSYEVDLSLICYLVIAFQILFILLFYFVVCCVASTVVIISIVSGSTKASLIHLHLVEHARA